VTIIMVTWLPQFVQVCSILTNTCFDVFNHVSAAGLNALLTESQWHTTSDMAQLVLPVVGAVAGAIPLAGPPIQAAIEGLLAILQSIDVRASFILTTLLILSIIIEESEESEGSC